MAFACIRLALPAGLDPGCLGRLEEAGADIGVIHLGAVVHDENAIRRAGLPQHGLQALPEGGRVLVIYRDVSGEPSRCQLPVLPRSGGVRSLGEAEQHFHEEERERVEPDVGKVGHLALRGLREEAHHVPDDPEQQCGDEQRGSDHRRLPRYSRLKHDFSYRSFTSLLRRQVLRIRTAPVATRAAPAASRYPWPMTRPPMASPVTPVIGSFPPYGITCSSFYLMLV